MTSPLTLADLMAQVLDRLLQPAVAPAPRHPCTVAPPPNVPRPCGTSAAARVVSIFRLRDGSHEAGDGAGGGARRIGKGRDCTVCWVGDAAQSASITRRRPSNRARCSLTSFHRPSNCLPNNTVRTSQSDARLACRRRPDIGSTNQDRPRSGRGGAEGAGAL